MVVVGQLGSSRLLGGKGLGIRCSVRRGELEVRYSGWVGQDFGLISVLQPFKTF